MAPNLEVTLLVRWLERGRLPLLSPGGLHWLLENQDLIKSWLGTSKGETQGAVTERAGALLDELEGEDKARLELLQRALANKSSETT